VENSMFKVKASENYVCLD